MTTPAPPDALEIVSALNGHWRWLDARYLVLDYRMGKDSKDDSDTIVRVDRRLLVAGFYEMINSVSYRALSQREQRLVPVVADGVRRLHGFLSAVEGCERLERDYQRKIADADPDERKRLEAERSLVFAASDDSHLRELTGAIAEFSKRSRTVRRKLREHRNRLPSKHQLFKRAGLAQLHPYLRERWLPWWLDQHLAEVEQELAWYEEHLRGPRGMFPTGHEGPVTNAEWRRIRDEQRASLQKHGARQKEIAALFGTDTANADATVAEEGLATAGLDAKDKYDVARELGADREKKRNLRAVKKARHGKKS